MTEAIFRECSGLSVETEVEEYPEGGVNGYVHKLPKRTKFSNITLKRGMSQSDELWKWYGEIISGSYATRPVSIILFRGRGLSEGKPVARWDLQNAYPIKWQGPDLRADGNTVAIETLVLAHAGWTLR